MKRIVAIAMVGSLMLAGCGRGVLTATTPSDTSAAGTGSAGAPAVGGMIESIEKPTRGISGALIQITRGPNAGKSTVSDDSGSFAILDLVPGPVGLQVSKSGYEVWSSKDFDLTSATKLAIELFPTPPVNSSGSPATGRCNDGGWTWDASPAAACTNNGGLAYGVCPGPLCKAQ